jgi:HEAT repeat protein
MNVGLERKYVKNLINKFRGIRKVKLEVDEVYLYLGESLEGVYLPFKEVAKRFLSYAGVEIVKDGGHEAVLKVRVEGEVLRKYEFNFSVKKIYLGISLKGRLSFKISDTEVYEKVFDVVIEPYKEGMKPTEAPFMDAFYGFGSFVDKLIEMMEEIFGFKMLVNALNDEDEIIRVRIIEFLEKYGKAGIPYLVNSLRDESSYVRWVAVHTLISLKWKPKSIEEKVKYFIARKEWKKCVKLGRLAVKFLVEMINDKDDRIRRKVLWTLDEIGEKDIKALIKGFEDYDMEIERKFDWSFFKAENLTAFDMLIKGLGDDDLVVRRVTEKIIRNINDARLDKSLIKALLSKKAEVRMKAAEILRKKGKLQGVVALIESLWDKKNYVKRNVRDFIIRLLDSVELEPRGKTKKAVYHITKHRWAKYLDIKGSVIRALEDEDSHVRKFIAQVLDELGWKPRSKEEKALYFIAKQNWDECVNLGNSAVKFLIDRLRDKDSKVRYEALKTLVRMGYATVDVLIELLKDEDKEVRKYVVWELRKKRDPKVVDALIEALKDENWEVRSTAAEALGKIGDERAINALIELQKDTYECVLVASAKALAKMKSPRVVDKLIEAFMNKDVTIRMNLAWSLGEARNKLGVKPLIKALSDKDGEVRRYAVESLRKIGDLGTVDALIKALGDEEKCVRWSAAEALEKIGWKPRSDKEKVLYYIAKSNWEECIKLGNFAVRYLINRLRDKDRRIRRGVVWALGKIGGERAVTALIDALKDDDAGVRRNASWALVKIGDSRAVDGLIGALNDKSEWVRRNAAEALGNIGDPRAISGLIKALKDENVYVRRSVVEALGKIGDVRAVNRLIKALRDRDKVVCYLARKALVNMLGVDFGYDYKIWEKFWKKVKVKGLFG